MNMSLQININDIKVHFIKNWQCGKKSHLKTLLFKLILISKLEREMGMPH